MFVKSVLVPDTSVDSCHMTTCQILQVFVAGFGAGAEVTVI